MAILSRDVFQQIKEELVGCNSELVEVQGGLYVKVVQLTADAGFALLALNDKDDDADKNRLATYRWICASCVDEQNNPIFKPEDFKYIPFDMVQKLTKAVNKVNHIGIDATEEAEKN